jgi:hypothetical protein
VFNAHAASNVSVGGLSLFRETDGLGDNSDDAVKTYVDARISIDPDDTNGIGEPHTFVVTVEENDGTGWAAAAGESVTITFPGGAPGTVDDSDCATTDVLGQCDVDINSAVAGVFNAHAASNVSVGGLSLFRETDGVGDNSDDAVKTYVDARISIDPDDTNEVDDPHTFVVTVEENDGTGWAAAAGESVTITFPGGAPGTVDDSDCATTDVLGQCDVDINSAVAGVFNAHAASNVSVGGLSLFRETDGLGDNSDDAVKTYVDGSLRWLKHDSQGNLLGGATFEVCRTHDRFGTDITDECVTVLDNNAPDTDGDDGEFMLDDLFLGRWTIEETVPPIGFEGDPFVETIELTLASPNGVATHIWVNTPNQGCTPGWWKNSGLTAWDQPTDPLAIDLAAAVFAANGNVVDGTTSSLFKDVFDLTDAQMTDAGLATDLTLLQAVELGGGDFKALARHGVSALLNSLSVAYEFDASYVLSEMHDAYVNGVWSDLLADLSTANQRDHSGCPTGGDTTVDALAWW